MKDGIKKAVHTNSDDIIELFVSQGNKLINTGNLDNYVVEKLAEEKAGKYKKVLDIRRTQARQLTARNGDFMFIYQYAFNELAKRDYTQSDYKILMYIISKIDYGIDNYLKETHQEIADELGLGRTNVTKSISKLSKDGFIQKVKSGSRTYLTISSDVGFKGRLNSAWKKAEAERKEEEERLKVSKEEFFKNYEV